MAIRTEPLMQLLREIANKYKLDAAFVKSVEMGRSIELTDRDDLIDRLALELCETGLEENDEPNSRGLLLEELIDFVLHIDQRTRSE